MTAAAVGGAGRDRDEEDGRDVTASIVLLLLLLLWADVDVVRVYPLTSVRVELPLIQWTSLDLQSTPVDL